MFSSKILIVDDNASFLELFRTLPGADQFNLMFSSTAEEAWNILRSEAVDLIICDVRLPGMSGTDLFNKVQDTLPEIPFILITAFGSTENAIEAVKKGAFHYFEKPLTNRLDLFWATVREALAKRNTLKELNILREERHTRNKAFSSFIGRSPAIEAVKKAVSQVAGVSITVLIEGETGTGKELVARAIHELSPRCDKPFFAVNCSEFSSGVLESELFGHEKGAFTGAVAVKKGLFELADQGTLFLDEISESPAYLQPKLLRVLESGAFKRVGGSCTLGSDFRIIAATNKDLKEEVASGRFRKDLFYRLNVFVIHIPPLRERKQDIPLLAEHYLKRFARSYHRPAETFSENAILTLIAYDWPGNVRELVNVVERAVITCTGSLITTRQLHVENPNQKTLSDLNLKDMERFYIELALKRSGNNKSKAAEILGISRKTLIEKVKRYEQEL